MKRKLQRAGISLLLAPVAVWAILFLLQWVIPKPEVAGFALETFLFTLAPISVITGLVLLVLSKRKQPNAAG